MFFLQIKTGNVGVLSQVSFLLVAKDWPLQVRIYASKMLQVLAIMNKECLVFLVIEIKSPLLIA